MTKRMLIDATHDEETRVAFTDGHKLIEYDYESQSRKPLKGSIFLAKVTRVEPSLQAAFVNFGGNRHGFLPFSEIHPDYFRIPISDREALMAEQEAMLREQDEADALEDEIIAVEGYNPSDENEFQDAEEEYIEEIGGVVASFGDDEDGNAADVSAPVSIRTEEAESQGFVNDTDEDASSSHDHIHDDHHDHEDHADHQAEGHGDEDGQGEGEDSQGTSEGGRDDRRGGRRNFRGRGRGRRSPSRNRNPEMVGGEDAGEDDNRFRFSLRRKYKIQEVIKRGQIMLVQVNKEERGNKGAAVGTYLSLPGRYCVLMPNSPRAGGVSRKIANFKDRARMRELVRELEVPKGMSVIVRTAGVTRTKAEIKRDLDYLMRLWDSIRELTLKSSAPALVYEEADLIKRVVRDLYTREIEEILVSGEEGFKTARNFMKMMIPSHVAKVKQYEDQQLPLFSRYQIEGQINEIGQPEVRLKSGGYLVINPTEALVSIDVNSGKATKGRHIEETALKTNLEAADEVARQLKLRDLGGLVVVDFIDMEDRRNNAKVERRMKEALSTDRARVQVGRISSFGLMEMSRQRLSPSLTEAQYEKCKTCSGIGLVRTREAMSIVVLRAIEEEGIRARASEIIVHVSNEVALYILNYKRKSLTDIEGRYGLTILLRVDDAIAASEYRVEVSKALDDKVEGPVAGSEARFYAPSLREDADDVVESDEDSDSEGDSERSGPSDRAAPQDEQSEGARRESSRRRGRRGGRRRRGNSEGNNGQEQSGEPGSQESVSRSEEMPVPVAEVQVVSEVVAAPESVEIKKPAGRPRRVPIKSNDENQAAPDVAAAGEVGEETAVKPAVRKRAPKKSEQPLASNDDQSSVSVVVQETKPVPPPPAPREYEVVNQEPKEKKRGWWNRLVE